MGHVKPLAETPDSVTSRRTDYEAMLEEIEDAEDRVAVLEDCLLDTNPEQDRVLLSMAETMRIIDGESPIRVWREKKGITIAELADATGVDAPALEKIERGAQIQLPMLVRVAAALEVPLAMLEAGATRDQS